MGRVESCFRQQRLPRSGVEKELQNTKWRLLMAVDSEGKV